MRHVHFHVQLPGEDGKPATQPLGYSMASLAWWHVTMAIRFEWQRADLYRELAPAVRAAIDEAYESALFRNDPGRLDLCGTTYTVTACEDQSHTVA